ncbi:signal-transducing adaptor protein 1-like isoform X2 [Ptychodera flava]|uniref:signal-transducing adaptor protein 1-like isoform X2 n=1 Tax=Ptychodera flava TaxID=63121 RepID=UPI00396A7D45
MAFIEEGRYLEGYLEWKGPKSKNFQKVWTLLQHTTVYFYQIRTGDMRESMRRQQTALACININSNTQFEVDKKEPTRFTINVGRDTHKLKASKTEEVDRWRSYILSFAKRRIPDEVSQLILPGQRNDLYRALEIEFSTPSTAPPVPDSARPPMKDLRSSTSSNGSAGSSASRTSAEQALGRLSISSTGSASSSIHQDMRYYPDHLKNVTEPTWFFRKISRSQSEEILKNNRDKGDILIRERESNPGELVLSARLMIYGREEIRHYRILKEDNLFVLDIDEKHPPILNLYELLNYFIDKTGGYPSLRPLVTNDINSLKLPPHLYERGILTRADKDPESGEWGPKPIPPEIYEQSDYLEPDSNHNESKTPGTTHSYMNQSQVTQARMQATQSVQDTAPGGPRQLIPRPQVNVAALGRGSTGRGVMLDTPIPPPQSQQFESHSEPSEDYYNADAIQLHQRTRRPPESVLYQNQPPVPSRPVKQVNRQEMQRKVVEQQAQALSSELANALAKRRQANGDN